MAKYNLSQNGILMIEEFEAGNKFYPKAYLDGGGVPTIGYGTTIYPNGKSVKLSDPIITKEQGVQYLNYEVDIKGEPALDKGVKVQLNQNQVDSLLSFIYNVGVGAFLGSTLLKKINSGASCAEIKEQFLRWNKDNGKIIKGLTIRRTKEADNYCQ